MGTIYRGFGLSKEIAGTLDGDTIYSGFGLGKTIVGTIDGDTVYSGFGLGKSIVGYIDGNTIYSGFGMGSEIAGYIDGDSVYQGFGLSKQLVGTCSNAYEAAALLLLLTYNSQADNTPILSLEEPSTYTSYSTNMSPSHKRVSNSMGEFAALYYIAMGLLLVIIIVGPLMIWPLIFSSKAQAEPGAALYTLLTICVSIFGLMVTTRWGSRKRLFDFLFLAAVSGGALLDFVLFFIDRANWTIPRALFAIPAFIYFTCGIPGTIIWFIIKRKSKNIKKR